MQALDHVMHAVWLLDGPFLARGVKQEPCCLAVCKDMHDVSTRCLVPCNDMMWLPLTISGEVTHHEMNEE